MMRKRHLQVKWVKDKKEVAAEKQADDAFYTKLAIVSMEVETALKKIAIGVAGYILLDTFRQSMIENAKNRKG